VEPEMQRPFKNRNKISCHKLPAKLDKIDEIKADSEAAMRTFLLPNESPRIPQVCDVKIIPEMSDSFKYLSSDKSVCAI
jgi:hypothetical protein